MNPNEQMLAGGRWNGPMESTPAHYVANYTMELMDQFTDRDQPFFMNCQFWGPHGPHLPCDGFYGMHDRDAIPPWANWSDDLNAKPGRIERESNDFYRNHPRTWEECKELVGLYYDTTAMIDHQIGRLLDYLADRGLRENTIVVLSTDHGDMTGSHGGQLDKGMLYQEVQHIPMILSWPGKIAAAANDTLAMNMDIMPTLMDFAGIPVPDGLDGISLKPAVSDRMNDTGRKEVYLEFHGLRFLYSQRAIITDDNWKYIFTPGDRDEIYDLNSDAAEMHNLIDSQKWSSKRQALQERISVASAGFKDPLRDCISKFFGIWNTESGQIDATNFF